MSFVNDYAGNVPTRMVKRAASSLPATASADIFSCNGLVKILGIQGVVTTAIQNQACTLVLTYDPDNGGSNINMHTATDIDNDGLGTVLVVPGAVGSALTESTTVAFVAASGTAMIMDAGDILWTTNATNTGAIEWYILYQPIEKIGGEWAEIVAV